MKDTVQKRFTQAATALVALALVLTVLGPLGTVAAAPGVSVAQQADSTTVAPGETVQFTTTLNVDSLDTAGLGLAVETPDGWALADQTTGDDVTFKETANEWAWIALNGISGDRVATYTVTVPESADDGTYTVSATGMVVKNSETLTTTDETTVTVETAPSNTPPVADAGDDQTVDEGAAVGLDASGSTDADGDDLSYAWTVANDAGASVSLSGDDSATPSFTAPAVDSETTLTFAVSVTDGDATDTDTVSVTVLPVTETPDPDEVTVRIDPASASVAPGGDATFDVVVDSEDVGAVDLTLSLANDSVATIEGVDTPANDGSEDITNDGQTVTIEAYGLQNEGANGETVVATVTVGGVETGSTTLALDGATVYDVQGIGYATTVGGDASVTVTFPALSDELQPPTNLDGDAVLEDVNGDGVFDVGDAGALFANRDSPVVQNNPERFDFNDNGGVDIGDVQAAFYQAVLEDSA